jgi:hypothetical protein
MGLTIGLLPNGLSSRARLAGLCPLQRLIRCHVFFPLVVAKYLGRLSPVETAALR